MDFASIGINLEQSNLLTWGVCIAAVIAGILFMFRLRNQISAFLNEKKPVPLWSNLIIGSAIVFFLIVGLNMRTQRKIKVEPDTTMQRNLQDHVDMSPEEVRQHRESIRQKRADQWKTRKEEARKTEQEERERLRKQLMGK